MYTILRGKWTILQNIGVDFFIISEPPIWGLRPETDSCFDSQFLYKNAGHSSMLHPKTGSMLVEIYNSPVLICFSCEILLKTG